jgi:hypothetical protein
MTTESGDKKLLGNFRKLIDEVSADPAYNPANDKLKITTLEAQYTAGDAAVDVVAAARAPHKLARIRSVVCVRWPCVLATS